MKYLAIILLSLMASATTCGKKGKRTDLSTKKAAAFLLGKKIDTVQWRLVNIYDPYDGGKTIIKDSLNPEILVVSRDGSFKEYDKDNYSIGKWYLNREKSRMAMVYEKQNGMEVAKVDEEMQYRYEIREMTDSKLILAIQGRHGMVERTYMPVSENPDATESDTLGTEVEVPIEKE